MAEFLGVNPSIQTQRIFHSAYYPFLTYFVKREPFNLGKPLRLNEKLLDRNQLREYEGESYDELVRSNLEIIYS